MYLARIGVVVGIAIAALIEAVIISIMHDSANGKNLSIKEKKHLFHKWLIIWAAVNSIILVTGYYIATGTLLGISI